MIDQYNAIITQIDAFIKKHYLFRLLYGAIIALAIFLAAFLLIVSLEYSGHYSIEVRTVLFYILLASYVSVFLIFVLRPLAWFMGFGKQISRKQAARMIADSIPEIKDSLLNLLELKELQNPQFAAADLLEASIRQRSEALRLFSFPQAVNFKKTKKPARFLLMATGVFILVLLINPGIVTEGSGRLLHYSTFYEKPAPFSFQINTDNLQVKKGDNVTIDVKLIGESLPDQVLIHFSGSEMLMMKESIDEFSYEIRNINNDFTFYVEALKIRSPEFRVAVIPVPLIYSFSVDVRVPAYTGVENFKLENTGNITVPAGSVISWNLKTAFMDSLFFLFLEDTIALAPSEKQMYEYSLKAKNSGAYTIQSLSTAGEKSDMLKYALTVIPDLYPAIDLEDKTDSVRPYLHYFRGKIADDYGFTALKLVILKEDQIDSTLNLPFNQGLLDQEYLGAFDFSVYHQQDKVSLTYYIEVTDNDVLNAYKSSRSQVFTYTSLSEAELSRFTDEKDKELDDMLKQSRKLSDDLLKDLNELKEKSLNEKLTEWEQSKKLDQLVNQQQQLEDMLDKVKDLNQLKNELENTYNPENDEILKKQQELEELMNNLFDEELKDLMKQLQDLQKQFDPKKMKEMTEDMKMSLEDLKNELDRNLELLKKYDIERDMDKAVEKMNELSRDQQDLSEKINKEGINEELLKQEEQQKQEFEELKKEYEENMQKNGDLKNPLPLQDMKQQMQSISNNFSKDDQQMKSGNKKESGKGTSKNSKELKDAANALASMMQQMRQEQQGENIDDLKQIVDNLILFSFDQEQLSLKSQKIGENDPAINKIILEQNKLGGDFEIIRDSLNAFAMREPRAGSLINKELSEVSKKFSFLKELEDNPNMQIISREQQFIMTSANNLALLLSEMIQQMEQEMNSMGQPKDGENCNKPSKKGKPGMKGMKDMQQGLKQQLQKMLEQMKQGQGGEGNKFDKESMNRQLAQMLAQQEIFRDMLNKMMNDKGTSSETQKILQEINKMSEEFEKDLVNKRITPDLMNRQQKILTRLLEAEKSDNKREFEEKRESKENKKTDASSPEDFFKQQKSKQDMKELIEYQDIKLRNYYDLKYKNYLKLRTGSSANSQ